MIRRLYSLLIYCAVPFAFAAVLWRGLRDRSYWQGLSERFGWGLRLNSAPAIWLHAVSLGEMSAAAPLVRALRPLKAWVTGQRRDQSPGTRAEVPVAQLDSTFGSPERPLVKFNPLANWSSKQVWAYIREHGVPYNALHERGFSSIGCEPCTKAINPGQHEREGRWWWEEETLKECGLHAGNVRPPR